MKYQIAFTKTIKGFAIVYGNNPIDAGYNLKAGNTAVLEECDNKAAYIIEEVNPIKEEDNGI